jgi:hypothetical protein
MKPVESKARFALSLAEMIVVYIVPQVGVFYLFSRWFLR